MSRTLTRSPVRSLPSLENMQHFVMEDASWELYENLLRDIGDRPIRVTYDNGRMEIMSPLAEHEDAKKFIGRMIEALTFEMNVEVKCLGSTTFKRKDIAKGLEPDQCYYIRDEVRMRGRKRLNMKKDPPPELVVEIDIFSRSIHREPIYAALGVPEIWRYDGRQLHCLHLVKDSYQVRKNSLMFPFLEPAQLQKFIDMLATHGETTILRLFIASVKKSIPQ